MQIPALAPELQKTLLVHWEPLCRSQLHYLITWGTRGRRPVLRTRHLEALETQIRSMCEQRGFSLLEVAAGADHVHLMLALRPTQSVASVVRELKGRTGMALLGRFPELRVWLRGNLMWDERFAVETVSASRVEPMRVRLRALHGSTDDLAATG